MRKIHWIILLTILAAVFCLAEETAKITTPGQSGPSPKIVAPVQQFNFGFAPEGFFLAHSFVIKNEGDAELKIERVRTTCGCTSAPMKKMHLEPDEETEVTVVFNSRRYTRKTTKSAIITSDDPMNRSIRLSFTADMTSGANPFPVEPWGMDIGQGVDPPQKMTFTISNPMEEDMPVEIVDYCRDIFEEPELSKDKIKSGKDIEMEVELNDDFDAASTYIKGSVTLAIGEENPTLVTIPIMGAGPK